MPQTKILKEEVFRLLEETASRCRNQTYPIDLIYKWLSRHPALDQFKVGEMLWKSMGCFFWEHYLWFFIHEFKKTQMMVQNFDRVTFKYWEV